MTREALLNGLGVIFGALFVLNGIGALIAPRQWVDSWWALKGPLTLEGLEKKGMNIQVRIAGAALRCFGLIFMVSILRSVF